MTPSRSSMHLSEDPRRQVLQRRIYRRQAQRWQAWWEANWRNFTDDAAYQKVNLNVGDEPLPPAAQALGKTARLSGEWNGAVLSPATEEGQYAWHAYDLDTGYRPNWPTRIPRDEAARDPQATGGLGGPERRRFDLQSPIVRRTEPRLTCCGRWG